MMEKSWENIQMYIELTNKDSTYFLLEILALVYLIIRSYDPLFKVSLAQELQLREWT